MVTAFALAVEIGDWHRFTGNTIGSFVGLVPSEHSSGSARVQGSITKTGNTHATPAARARGDAGNRRLNARWDTFTARRKKPVIANVAIARELAGWCWSLAVTDD
jgi:transposase